MKNTIILILLIIIGFGGYYFLKNSSENQESQNQINTETNQNSQATTTVEDKTKTIIGKSVGGEDIVAYHYGEGETEVLFVGGIHGGYGWNTALLGYEAMDYLKANPDMIATSTKVTIIPVLNPDGLEKVVGTTEKFDSTTAPTNTEKITEGRFNASEVDLNRNFDCDWASEGKWQNKTVSGGTEVFSEPEAKAIKNYVEKNNPSAVVVWYSAAGGVYSSSCHNGILEETKDLTNAYADASGYKGYDEFESYEVTGDLTNWLAKIDIPAISVLLSNHEDVEWEENKKGIEAVLNYFDK